MTQHKIEESSLFPKVKIITPAIFEDDRGAFIETYSVGKYTFKDENGNALFFKEDDISISRKNVLRGLHGDKITWKLIQCLHGEVFFALVDNNPASRTYLQVETYVLNDVNRHQILVPPYFVNGYLCLSDKCIFSYKQTETYTGGGNQVALRWNEPKLNIAWPVTDPIISQRDGSISYL